MVVLLSKVSRVWRWDVCVIHQSEDGTVKNGDVTKSLLYRIMMADTRPNGCSVFNLGSMMDSAGRPTGVL